MIDTNIPRTVKIGPYQYKIEIDGETAWDWGHNARTYYRSNRISFNDRISETGTPQVLMHEVLHCLAGAYDIGYWLDHDSAKEFPKDGDKIDLMATALLTFIRDNPEVVKYLGVPK